MQVNPNSLKNLKPFQKGHAPCSPGRPKALATLIREQTKDGAELIDFYKKVWTGELKNFTTKDRMTAAEWLSDRAFGKAPDTVQHLDLNDQQNELAKAVAASLLSDGVIIADTK